MISVRVGTERGRTKTEWLDGRHTFSFGQYYDENHMGFRHLRVINQDRIAGGGGFPMHPHNNMEIITYVLEGALRHEDSLGHRSVIEPPGVQVITAGTGIRHSEFNHSRTKAAHILQIWIEPSQQNLPPEYREKVFEIRSDPGRMHLICSHDSRDGSLQIHQDVALYAARLGNGDRIEHRLDKGRHAWVHLASGNITINDVELGGGDGASIREERELHVTSRKESDIILFDLA